jgi:hypothetical protein
MPSLKPLLSDLTRAAVPPAVIVLFQYARMTLLPDAVWIDAFSHFFGGAAIALSAMIVFRRWQARAWIHADALVRDYAVIMTSLFFGTAWEWWEFWMQRWTGEIYQFSMGDTMQDLFMDTIGGLLLVLIYRLRKR